MSANLSDEASSPPSKTSLQKWWKRFNKKPDRPTLAHNNAAGVFGVSLQDSLRYASVAISQVGPDGKARIYGHIPIVVAKTGLYLKENGTTTQGVFRVSGSNKRIKELEQIFDSYPSYGKNLTWDNFSVHDAASVFRRYLNMLPEPIIPFVLYQSFRDALRKPVVLGDASLLMSNTARRHDAEGSHASTIQENAVVTYKGLINSLPPASQHIFFYVLDLLGVFARKSEQNLMPASNLATIFQPGLLRHQPTSQPPSEDDRDAVRLHIEADASEHKKSQEVLEFLIRNQSSFELELPPHVLAGKKASKRKSTTPSAISTSKSTSPPRSPILQSRPLAMAQTSPVIAEHENDWHSPKRDGLLVRRGSDKSEDRRRMRRKKQEQKRIEESGQVSVKRSRTLPNGKEGRKREGEVKPVVEPLKPRSSPMTVPTKSAPIPMASTNSSAAPSRPATAPIKSPPLSSSANVNIKKPPTNLTLNTSLASQSPRSPAMESASDMSVSPTPEGKNRWWRSSRRASMDTKALSASRSNPQ